MITSILPIFQDVNNSVSEIAAKNDSLQTPAHHLDIEAHIYDVFLQR